MIRFGPSGNSDLFYEQGYKHTWQAFAWLHAMGLSAFEYSFGHGVRMHEDTASVIREEARRYNFALSVHAPYYINLAAGKSSLEKNLTHLEKCAMAAQKLGADRVVFHPGSLTGQDRHSAVKNTLESFSEIYVTLCDRGYGELNYCPETMGKINQVGDLPDIAALCGIGENIIPAVDFAHIHARSQGSLAGYEDYEAILDFFEKEAGEKKTKAMHVHFSKIAFTKAGEKMHMLFSDQGYGPDFAPLAKLFAERSMQPRVICESRGTQASDALIMMEMYNAKRAEYRNSI